MRPQRFRLAILTSMAGALLAATAGAGEVTFRYFRFSQTELRDGAAANSIQLSEFEVVRGGLAQAGAAATNPGGNNPANETPDLAVDGFTDTKWLDFNRAPLVLDFGAPVTIDGYRFATANDATERDPVSWTFAGSDDGVTWTPLDQRQGFPTPIDRFTYTEDILLPDAVPPVIDFFRAVPTLIGVGESANLEWSVSGATSVTISPGVGAVDPVGDLDISPAQTTTYLLEAVNGAGSVEAEVTVRLIVPTTHTFRYFRFTQTALRDGAAANSIQLSEFEFLDDGGAAIAGATATNPGGNNPAAETPDLAVDGITDTKWLDFNRGPLVLDFGAPVTAGGYRFATANDAIARDPVSWTIEGSSDGTAWTLLDVQELYPTPAQRFTYTDEIRFTQAALPAVVRSFAASAALIVQGESATLSWDTANAQTVTISPGIGEVTAAGSTEVSPTETTTYTLEAVSPGGTAISELTIEVIQGAGAVVFRYFRFVPTALRNDVTANSVQISEFEVLFDGDPVTGATATNPDGNNPANETPDLAVDGITDTKWLDFNRGPLLLDFGAPTTIDGYRFATANDATERDPVSWRFEGSDNGIDWTLIDERVDYPTPTLRFTYIAEIPFPGISISPLRIVSIAYDRIAGQVTLTWASRPSRFYIIERSANLKTWFEVDDSVESEGEETSYVIFVEDPLTEFYRVLEQQ